MTNERILLLEAWQCTGCKRVRGWGGYTGGVRTGHVYVEGAWLLCDNCGGHCKHLFTGTPTKYGRTHTEKDWRKAVQ